MIPDERGKSRTSAGSEMLNAAREVAYQRERRLGVMCVMVARNPTPQGLCRGQAEWLKLRTRARLKLAKAADQAKAGSVSLECACFGSGD
jgi:hypothetical protein